MTANGNRPKLACCNFIEDLGELRAFALEHGFDGIDWSFKPATLPVRPAEQSRLLAAIRSLEPLVVRYHCAFPNTDPGATAAAEAAQATERLRQACRVVSKLGGRHLTMHIGLGLESTVPLSWDRTVAALGELVRFADNLGVGLCLENLAWGWTSRPELYEKLIRKSGARATLDIGHARVSPSVQSRQYEVEDFVAPHPERFLNAHVYHLEEGDRHLPPARLFDLEDRLRLLQTLPACDWWVLELREKGPLLQTLQVVRAYFETAAAAGEETPRAAQA